MAEDLILIMLNEFIGKCGLYISLATAKWFFILSQKIMRNGKYFPSLLMTHNDIPLCITRKNRLKNMIFYLKFSSGDTILIVTINPNICQMATSSMYLNIICIVTWHF